MKTTEQPCTKTNHPPLCDHSPKSVELAIKVVDFFFEHECKSYAKAYTTALLLIKGYLDNNWDNLEIHKDIKDQWTSEDAIEAVILAINLNIPPSEGIWREAVSSGYDGWICKTCATWVYKSALKRCKCDVIPA